MIIRLAIAHLKQFFRDPIVMFWAVFFPLVLAAVLGTAFSPKPLPVYTIPVIGDVLPTVEGYKFSPVSQEEALAQIRQNRAPLYLTANTAVSATSQWHIHRDFANQEAVVIAERLRADLLAQQVQPSPKSAQPEIKQITTQGSRFIDFLVPGLLAFSIMNSLLWGVAWVLIEYRMKKLLRRLTSTPMRRFDFLLSFVVARLVVTMSESLLLIGFAYLMFDITIQGSILALFLLYLAANYGFGGLAVLCGSRAENTQVGNGIVNAITLPSTILSGVFFSYQNFPDWAVPILKWLPLSVVADAARAIFNEGAGLAETAPALAVMFGIGSLCMAAGIKIFRWS